MNISLGKHWDEYIAGLVDSGRYASASEAVRNSLRLLQAEEDKLTALRAHLDAAEARGGSHSDEEVGARVKRTLDQWENGKKSRG
jgi:antitoxin ParD1/3/4